MIYPYLTRAVVIINFDQAYLHTVIKYMYMYFYINKVLSPTFLRNMKSRQNSINTQITKQDLTRSIDQRLAHLFNHNNYYFFFLVFIILFGITLNPFLFIF